jgi:hypothetical protein
LTKEEAKDTRKYKGAAKPRFDRFQNHFHFPANGESVLACNLPCAGNYETDV